MLFQPMYETAIEMENVTVFFRRKLERRGFEGVWWFVHPQRGGLKGSTPLVAIIS